MKLSRKQMKHRDKVAARLEAGGYSPSQAVAISTYLILMIGGTP